VNSATPQTYRPYWSPFGIYWPTPKSTPSRRGAGGTNHDRRLFHLLVRGVDVTAVAMLLAGSGLLHGAVATSACSPASAEAGRPGPPLTPGSATSRSTVEAPELWQEVGFPQREVLASTWPVSGSAP